MLATTPLEPRQMDGGVDDAVVLCGSDNASDHAGCRGWRSDMIGENSSQKKHAESDGLQRHSVCGTFVTLSG